MPVFGPCNEPSCTENAVRLFDCAHHCMKLLCLQHLIEHDRLIDDNEQYFNNLRKELEQLWTTYSTLVNEANLRCEYEQKLMRHEQLVQEVKYLLDTNTSDIQLYQSMSAKLNQTIQQEQQSNQYAPKSCSLTEEVKSEPIDGFNSFDINNHIEQEKQQSVVFNSFEINTTDGPLNNSHTCGEPENIDHQRTKRLSLGKLTGRCSLWFNGAFGLTRETHGMYLCLPKNYHQELFRHFIKYHKLKQSCAEIIGRAVQNKENPRSKILFQPDEVIIDKINHYYCPYSIHNHCALTIIKNSSERPCRSIKPQFAYSLRYHLVRVHRMTITDANKLVNALKTNCKKCRT